MSKKLLWIGISALALLSLIGFFFKIYETVVFSIVAIIQLIDIKYALRPNKRVINTVKKFFHIIEKPEIYRKIAIGVFWGAVWCAIFVLLHGLGIIK